MGLGAASEAAGGLGSAASAKGAFSALVGSAAAKGVLAVALVGGAGLGVTALRTSASFRTVAAIPAAPAANPAQRVIESESLRAESAAVPTAVAPMAIPTPAPKPAAVARAMIPRPAPAPTSASDEARAREVPAEARMASRLREESAAVLSIRKTLLGGDTKEALRMLDRARVQFPNGALVEEREALAVRALVTSGQKDLARKRGEAFLQAFPKSPHASEVRAVLGP